MPTRFGLAAMGAGGISAVFILNENCEGTGTPASFTNVTGPGNINWDYVALPLAGSQSLYLTLASTAARTFGDFANQTEVWFYFLFRITNGTYPPVATRAIGGGAPTGSTTIGPTLSLLLTTGRVQYGTASPANALSIDTTYHMWLHSKQGTGADAVVDVGFSTDGVRPASGGNYAQITNGNLTALVGRIALGSTASTDGFDLIFDNIKVATTQIGDNGT